MAKKKKKAPPVIMDEPKRERGRPTKFNESIKARILELAKQGKTDVEICQAIGCSNRAYYNWKAKFPNFMQAIRDEKSIADDLVEASLFDRAMGYSHPAVKIFMTKDGETIEHHYVQHHPPDSTAMIFWLKNRQPERWREKQPDEVAKLQVNNFSLSEDEARARLEKLKNMLKDD